MKKLIFLLTVFVLLQPTSFAKDNQPPALSSVTQKYITNLIVSIKNDLKNNSEMKINGNNPLWDKLLENRGYSKKMDKGACRDETYGAFGQCVTRDRTKCESCACDYYVEKSRDFKDPCGKFGYPLNPTDHCSTGCVYAPNSPEGIAPKNTKICWPGYIKETMCTDKVLNNVAQQMIKVLNDSIADNKDYCNIGKMLECSK